MHLNDIKYALYNDDISPELSRLATLELYVHYNNSWFCTSLLSSVKTTLLPVSMNLTKYFRKVESHRDFIFVIG